MNTYILHCEVKKTEIIKVKAENIEQAKEEAKHRLDEFHEIEIEDIYLEDERFPSGLVNVYD